MWRSLSTASPPSKLVSTNRDKHTWFCARFTAADQKILCYRWIYLAEQLDAVRKDRTWGSSSIFTSPLDVSRRINNGYLNDRVANTDQTIAVSKVVLMFWKILFINFSSAIWLRA